MAAISRVLGSRKPGEEAGDSVCHGALEPETWTDRRTPDGGDQELVPALALVLVQGVPSGSTLRKKERDWGDEQPLLSPRPSVTQLYPPPPSSPASLIRCHQGQLENSSSRTERRGYVAKKWLGRSTGFPSTLIVQTLALNHPSGLSAPLILLKSCSIDLFPSSYVLSYRQTFAHLAIFFFPHPRFLHIKATSGIFAHCRGTTSLLLYHLNILSCLSFGLLPHPTVSLICNTIHLPIATRSNRRLRSRRQQLVCIYILSPTKPEHPRPSSHLGTFLCLPLYQHPRTSVQLTPPR